ncbi:helix-turn-helix transcriptional regulator [Rubinisphaera sp. JC750]|uniref:helix-turn-helix transcriptional regulator n=1 Tax=Rubinisphaera sp. JC750 TaxID=2898658 RepID=UPI001F1B0858|nr:helix-turn-helix domain-containing protein [Rubinisphaera sp. JC750]
MAGPIKLQFEVTINEENVELLKSLLINRTSKPDYERRAENSRKAIFAGEVPPIDESLLVNSRELAEMLDLSERTIHSMWKKKEMPAPIRIGRAVRWVKEEMQAWVNHHCPPASEWNWPTSQ